MPTCAKFDLIDARIATYGAAGVWEGSNTEETVRGLRAERDEAGGGVRLHPSWRSFSSGGFEGVDTPCTERSNREGPKHEKVVGGTRKKVGLAGSVLIALKTKTEE